MDWVASCSEGASGGIVIVWDTRVVQLVGHEESSHTLSCSFRNYGDDFFWVFICIYGPIKSELREDIWEDLGAIRSVWNDPWCLGGDFNVLRFPKERNRDGIWTRAMRRFSQVIEDLELKNLPLKGGCYTWVGGPGNQRMARLDRFLVSDDWEVHFGNSTQTMLPKPLSDHFPILLVGGGGGGGGGGGKH